MNKCTNTLHKAKSIFSSWIFNFYRRLIKKWSRIFANNIFSSAQFKLNYRLSLDTRWNYAKVRKKICKNFIDKVN